MQFGKKKIVEKKREKTFLIYGNLKHFQHAQQNHFLVTTDEINIWSNSSTEESEKVFFPSARIVSEILTPFVGPCEKKKVFIWNEKVRPINFGTSNFIFFSSLRLVFLRQLNGISFKFISLLIFIRKSFVNLASASSLESACVKSFLPLSFAISIYFVVYAS